MIGALDLAFDAVLAMLLAGLAWRALASPALFTGIVLFIVFGLLMAVAWLRLGAPDIALAEAAIGAGLTGVLFLRALDRIGRDSAGGEEKPAEPENGRQP
jgi:uncharacterized MnhB-related membrane protein